MSFRVAANTLGIARETSNKVLENLAEGNWGSTQQSTVNKIVRSY